MTYDFVNNGDTQLVLVPSNEVERLLLRTLLENDVEVVSIQDSVTILGRNLSGGIVVRRKTRMPETMERLEPAT
jgi:hypothetical protein